MNGVDLSSLELNLHVYIIKKDSKMKSWCMPHVSIKNAL